MFFEKKLKRSLEVQEYLGDRCCKKDEDSEKLPLEKKDWVAIALSALIVFGPLFLIIGGLAFWLTL